MFRLEKEMKTLHKQHNYVCDLINQTKFFIFTYKISEIWMKLTGVNMFLFFNL
jgi:hypothetical protein